MKEVILAQATGEVRPYDADPDDPDCPLKLIVPLAIVEGDEFVPEDRLNDDGGVTLWLNLDDKIIEGTDPEKSPLDFAIKDLQKLGMINEDLHEPEGLGDTIVELKFVNGWPRIYAQRESVLNTDKAQKMSAAFASAFNRASEDE